MAAPAIAATERDQAAARSRRRPMGPGTIRVITIVVAIAIWELLARSGWFYQDVIPPIWQIAYALFEELISAGFWHDLGVTLEEHVVGFTVGSALAITAGIALGANPFVRRAAEPYLNALGSTPKIIFLPILFLIFGTGIETKMANGALSAFFPVVFATMLGMVLVNPVHLRVGRSFNISRRHLITKVYIPSMIGPLMIGLKLGMAIAVTGVLVSEIRAANAGIGYRISNYYDDFQIAPLYALIIVCFSLAAFAHVGMSAVQRRFTRHESLDAETTERLQSQR